MQFSFGGDSGMTYEEMLQARKFAETARGTFQRPQNVGEGWGSIFANVGAGLVGRAADKAEAAGREEASEQFGRETSVFGDLLANRLGGGPTVSSMGGGQAPQAVRNTAMASNGGPTTGAADAMRVRQGLIERGLPEHVADGFVMNFEDESGLNPGINERNPLVEGSRGGFGLAQWTGPRRRALEQYAQQRGASVADADVQMDFLMTELQGPESRAAQSILSSKDAGQAGAAIVNDFLRPAEEHRARRVAEYTGGGGYSGGQGGGVSPGLMEAMSNPYMTDAQRSVLGMLFQQQMAASAPPDPMQALQMERAQLEIDQMRNPQADPVNGVEFGGDLVNPRTGEVILDGPDPETEAPMVKTVTRSDGSEVAVQWNGRTQTWDPINAPAGGGSLTDRLDLTESEGRVTLFKSLQDETSPVLLDYEERWDPSNVRDAVARRTPVAGNFFQSPEGQQYGALASQWAEGALRLATGAAATPEEMERTMTTYFARPGDTPETIQFKARMRESYTRSLRRAQGETQVYGRILTPAEFAAQQGGGRPPGGATGQPEPAPAEPSAWNGPSADEVRRMDQMTVRSMMNAYERNRDLIPNDVLDAIIEMGEQYGID